MPRIKLDRKTRSVSATMGEETYEQLLALSRAEDTSIARIIRRALGEFLERHTPAANPHVPPQQRQRA
jgi:hypothetical protein